MKRATRAEWTLQINEWKANGLFAEMGPHDALVAVESAGRFRGKDDDDSRYDPS